MVRCSNGHENLDQNKFCSSCGIEITKSPDPDNLGWHAPATPRLDSEGPRRNLGVLGQRINKKLIVIIGVIILLTLGVVLFTNGGSDKKTVRGVFTLFDSDVIGGWDNCSGTGGYDDFGAGMNVTVKDQDGKIVATGATKSMDRAIMSDLYTNFASEMTRLFGYGTLSQGTAYLVNGATFSEFCAVYLELKVPTRQFYDIEIGRRGTIPWSNDELKQQSYLISTELGQR